MHVFFSSLRMAVTTLALWLLLVAMLVPQRCCQHWSYGLSPGGKRQVDSLSETLGNIVEGLPHVDTTCRVIGCTEESPYARMYRLKGFLGSGPDRGNGHRTYEK
ncbi:progonadoliberin-1-like isoform X2 [Scophthalmus maximus]|uniref:progonadoliberin-1-like isoform X2 n=1 Tax=Scophthalmus maximus TaxID=52904 RepID=UPI000F376735|nr:progonadoliberin-1-like isoform X2 [Scophthalmus maximus]